MTDEQYRQRVADWDDPDPQGRPEIYMPGIAAWVCAAAAWVLVIGAVWAIASWL